MANQKLKDVIKDRYGKIARGEQTFCCPTCGPTTTDQCLAVGYTAEDLQLAYALKKLGRSRGQKFKLLHKGWIITSTRKIDQTPLWEMLAKLIGFGFGLQTKIRSKKYCEHWYDKAAR